MKVHHEVLQYSPNSYEQISGVDNPIPSPNSVAEGLNIEIDDDDEVTLEGCCVWLKQRFFTKEKLRRRFPVTLWIHKYQWTYLKNDTIAAISILFTIIPQALAFALLAGLPPRYGLYSSFVGCMMYTFLGTFAQSAIGPTSILAILTAPYVEIGGPTYSVLLSFFSGCLLLLLGLLNFGFILDFVSYPVISAFSSAAALTVLGSQLQNFFGLPPESGSPLQRLFQFIQSANEISLYDTLLALTSLLLLLVLKRISNCHLPTPGNWLFRSLNACLFFGCTARNAIVVLMGILLAAKFPLSFNVAGSVGAQLPQPHLPAFVICNPIKEISNHNFLANNATSSFSNYLIHCNRFSQTIQDLSGGVMVIVLVALVECMAVVKSFGEKRKVDATQEMLAIGASNFVGSFFGSMPVTASFSRSAVASASGVSTPLAGLITGSLVLIALSQLGWMLERIPQASLSAIIVAAIYPMVKWNDLPIIWRANCVDFIPYALTFGLCVFVNLQVGVLLGILFSLLILLYQMARPKVTIVQRLTPQKYTFLYVKPDRSVFFPSVEYMKVKIQQALSATGEFDNEITSNSPLKAVVIDGEHMFRADTTFAVSLQDLVLDLRNKRLITIFFNLHKAAYRALKTLLKDNEFLVCTKNEEVYELIQQRMEKCTESNGHQN